MAARQPTSLKKTRRTPPSRLTNSLIDIGADSRERQSRKRAGGRRVFESGFKEIGGLIKARALDNRAGCALLSNCRNHAGIRLTLAFTVQEEVGLRGAKTAAYGINPDIAIVVDSTTAADTAGVPKEKQVCRIGKGPVISFMDNRTLYDKKLFDIILDAAKTTNIKAQVKSAVVGGNDAGAIHPSKTWVRVAAVSLPCRYLHSASCMISKGDLEETLKLLERLIPLFAAEVEID